MVRLRRDGEREATRYGLVGVDAGQASTLSARVSDARRWVLTSCCATTSVFAAVMTRI